MPRERITIFGAEKLSFVYDRFSYDHIAKNSKLNLLNFTRGLKYSSLSN